MVIKINELIDHLFDYIKAKQTLENSWDEALKDGDGSLDWYLHQEIEVRDYCQDRLEKSPTALNVK